MRILLPPSEAKTSGGRGKSLAGRSEETADTSWSRARRPILRALQQVSAGPNAREALLLPVSVADAAIVGNLRIMTSPTRPALQRYSGVLYEGMDAPSFAPAQRRLATSSVLIFSGLFGVLQGGEPVPFYRVPAKAVLPGVGGVAGYWRQLLPDLMTDRLDDGLIIDLRSSDYRAMWRPGRSEADRLLTVRVLSAKPDGTLRVVSYSSKRHKGRLVASLLRTATTTSSAVTSAEDVIASWLAIGGLDARQAGNSLDLVAPN